MGATFGYRRWHHTSAFISLFYSSPVDHGDGDPCSGCGVAISSLTCWINEPASCQDIWRLARRATAASSLSRRNDWAMASTGWDAEVGKTTGCRSAPMSRRCKECLAQAAATLPLARDAQSLGILADGAPNAPRSRAQDKRTPPLGCVWPIHHPPSRTPSFFAASAGKRQPICSGWEVLRPDKHTPKSYCCA